MKFYKLYTDGSYQPDVNVAGIGGYLLDPQGNCIYEFSQPILDKSEFKSHESLALVHGLKKALELNITHLDCYSDDISFRNVLNNDVLSQYSYQNNSYRKHIFELKNQFSHIQFNYLPRKENKKADKLAGKILRIYKEETLPNRTREDFQEQSQNLLHIPQVTCEEDFVQQDISINIKDLQNKLEHHYVVEIKKSSFTVDNIDDLNPIDISVYLIEKNIDNTTCHLLTTENTIQKKLISKGLELLAHSFEQFDDYQLFAQNKSDTKPHIGLHFYADNQPLQKLEMLLRRRGILPIPDTPLTRRMLASSQKFDRIVLHNNLDIINMVKKEQHQLLPSKKQMLGL